MRTVALVAAALIGFASNSLLCRAALGGPAIDAVSFTGVRLVSGALCLWLLVSATARSGSVATAARRHRLLAPLALFGYAIAFSLAYVRLPAGAGALVLFAAVQLTMIGWGLRTGERLPWTTWAGLTVAFAGLVVLCRPGRGSPDPAACLAMAVAGVAWGLYSLLGRGSATPLRDTAGNFARTVPLAALASLMALSRLQATPKGVALAVASGALASAVGYSLWYAALPALSATRAAIVQLLVPVIAAAGGVALLGEAVTARLLVAAGGIIGGVGLTLARPR